MATARTSRRQRRTNPTGGGNEPWERQGQDCATLLRGFEEGDYRTWAEFVAVPDFHIFDRKYIRENLRRNFETTKTRWEDYHLDGSGLPPPRMTGGDGAAFVPGNDGEEEEEDLLDELQEDQEVPPPPPAARPPPPAAQVQPPPARREQNFDVGAVIGGFRNLGVDDDDNTMKGCFIQEVTDPDDPQRTTNRLGVYCVLFGGVHVDYIEVTRPATGTVKFAGTMDSRVGNAENFLGPLLADSGTVRALQASIDVQLRDHQSQGGLNDGSLPAEASVKLPPSPNRLGWKTGFVSQHDNSPVRDPLFFNRMASTDPEMQSDTLTFFAFLLETKAQDHSAPARGRRNRRNQVPAPAPAPAPLPRHHRNRQPAAQQPQPMNVDQGGGGTAPLVNVALASASAARRPRNTRASSPRRRQRLDEVASYIEESDEAVENNVDTSFESAQSNEYSDDYDDDDDDYGNVTTVLSED